MPESEQGLKLFTKKAFVVTGIVLGLAALFFMRTLVLMVFLALLVAILWDALTGFFVRMSGNRLPRTPMLAVSIFLSLSVVGGAGALLTVPLNFVIWSNRYRRCSSGCETASSPSLAATALTSWGRGRPVRKDFGGMLRRGASRQSVLGSWALSG